MSEYEKKFLLELDVAELEMEKKIQALTEDWSTDEMIDLLVECEMVLSYNEGRIRQLDVRGLKRLWHIITGIYAKNEQSVRENVQEIQRVSFKIQKILLRRVDLMQDALISLNRKVNAHTLMTQYWIYKLLQKFEGIQQNVNDAAINIAFTQWCYSVKNKETEDGKRYLDVSDGTRILLVVSDLFQIVHKRVDLVDCLMLKTALQNLRLDGEIKNADFYKDIIKEKEYLPLYVKDYYDYQTDSISYHGQMLHKIAEFYANPLLEEMSEFIDKPLEELCQQIISKKVQNMDNGISPVNLCMKLLDDLICLNSGFQEEMIEQAPLDEELMIPQGESLVLLDECKEKEKDSVQYSILRITPEELHLIRGKEDVLHKLNCTDKYVLKDEEMLKAYMESSDPYLVTASSGFFESCIPEIKEMLDQRLYVDLADYYMYLWFCCTDKEKRADQKLAFMEYYKGMVYVSFYAVNAAGDSYKKGESKCIPGKASISGMIKEIRSHEYFLGIEKNDILVFQTFCTNEQNLYKLGRDHNVKMVDNAWEDFWKGDQDELGNMIHDLTERSA